MSKNIYLDYASTTPTDPEVLKAMQPFFFEKFGNASSPHTVGQEAKKAIEDARQTLSSFIGAKLEEIVFTSGGTESNNHAILGVIHAMQSKGNHVITSKIEHHSVLEAISHLERQGIKVSYLGVDKNGFVNPEDVRKAVTDKTVLISIMHANNEIGTIQPIAEIGKIAKEKGITFHSDCIQTVGHIPVNVDELNLDLLSIAAHKFYGPKGVGALFIRKGTKISRFLLGGDQERGRRASTHNLPGIVGLGKAVELCKVQMSEEIRTQTTLRDKIINEISRRIDDAYLNGHATQRLPNNFNFSFAGVDGESLLMSLDMAGISVSMGSACTSGALEPSYVLRAIGVKDELALGSLRITLGRWTKEEQVDYFLDHLPKTIEQLRKMSSSGKK